MFMKKILVCCLGALLILPSLGLAAPAAQTDDAKKLAEVQAAIEQLKHQLDDIKAQRTDLEKQLQESETNINTTMKHVEELKKQIKEKEASQGALKAQKKN
jgi:septal ring factor EnvC (AmiA/AmiB activator)